MIKLFKTSRIVWSLWFFKKKWNFSKNVLTLLGIEKRGKLLLECISNGIIAQEMSKRFENWVFRRKRWAFFIKKTWKFFEVAKRGKSSQDAFQMKILLKKSQNVEKLRFFWNKRWFFLCGKFSIGINCCMFFLVCVSIAKFVHELSKGSNFGFFWKQNGFFRINSLKFFRTAKRGIIFLECVSNSNFA